MRLLYFLFFSSTVLSAQSNFLKNPDIVWAIEIEQDWVVDIPSLEEEWEQGIITLKQVRSRKNELHWSSPYLADLVFEAAEKGELNVFKDSDCKVITDPGAAYKLVRYSDGSDLVVTYDPITYEARVVEVYEQPEPFSEVKAWRLRQVLAYHKKSATWSTRVLSIAPLIDVRNSREEPVNLQPLFWFNPENKRPKLSADCIVWAKKTFSGKQARTEVPLHPASMVKTTEGFQNPMSNLLSVFETKKKSPFYDSQGDKLLSIQERKNRMPRTDTTVSYNLETHEATMDVKHKGISDSMIQQLRLVQTWYWDDRHARLSICLDAVAPMERVFSDWGDIRYNRPLFYRRAKR